MTSSSRDKAAVQSLRTCCSLLLSPNHRAVGQHRVRWALTGSTVAFLAVLTATFYAASSQQNSAAYVLLFGLISLGVVSIPHTFANVSGLTVRAEAIKPAFAGQEATLPIEVANRASSGRYGLRIQLRNSPPSYTRLDSVPAGKAVRATLPFSAHARGEHEIEM